MTKWADYGTASDVSDFLNTGFNGGPALTPNDPFNETYSNGSTFQSLTPVDLRADGCARFPPNSMPRLEPYDFTGDGNGDLVVDNLSDGRIGVRLDARRPVSGLERHGDGPGFFIQGVGKVSGNEAADVVIQDETAYRPLRHRGRKLYDALHNGYVSGAPGALSGYNVGGVGDINGSPMSNIVVQGGASNAQVYYASMTGGVFQNWVGVGFIPGWSVVAVADINGDGYADIVIQNVTTGQLDYAEHERGVNNGSGPDRSPRVRVLCRWRRQIERDGHADLVIENPLQLGNRLYRH